MLTGGESVLDLVEENHLRPELVKLGADII